MLKHRVIPTLLIQNGDLIKTSKFKNAEYIGDPVNAIKIFNEKEVDELIVLDEDNPMEEIKNYTKKRRLSDKSKKKKSSSVFKLPSFLKK